MVLNMSKCEVFLKKKNQTKLMSSSCLLNRGNYDEVLRKGLK